MLTRLTTLLALTIVATLSIAGDHQGRAEVEVARAATASDPGLLAASVATPSVGTVTVAPPAEAQISAAEAIELALAAGDVAVEAEEAAPAEAAVERAVAVAAAVEPWFVTGSRVNLREGPGTGHAIVGQAGLGDAAEILSDPAESWVRIRTEAGLEAYIYGQFLDRTRP